MPKAKATAESKTPAPLSPFAPVSRIILFVKNVPITAAWYRKIFGLKPLGEITKGWAELDAGGISIAFHRCSSNQKQSGKSHVKFCFGVADVAAAKALLESRGATLGPAHISPELSLCDGIDPEGNRFQLSSRGVSRGGLAT